jgi:signal transduction histidine kinase
MSDRAVPTAVGRQRHRAPAATVLTSERSVRSLSLLPALVVGLLLAAAWTLQALGHVPAPVAIGAILLTCGPVLLFADRRAQAVAGAARRQQAEQRAGIEAWLARLTAKIAEGRKDVALALGQVERGELTVDFPYSREPTATGDPYAAAERALESAQTEAWQTVFLAAVHQNRLVNAEREQADVFLAIAGRLQALVSRTIDAIDIVERDIEDPDQLNQVFKVDHLATQIRRAVESLAVLGGRMPPKTLQPLPLSAALRGAVAEVEDFARVRVTLPQQDRALPGYAGPGVVHLLAELVENATKFSPPDTEVQLRATAVPAGLAIEVEDRGLPMSPAKLEAMNRLLEAPETVDLREQIKSGRIGLLVAARLAFRHHIRVVLRPNVLGGTQAVVILPTTLLLDPSRQPDRQPAAAPQPPNHPIPPVVRPAHAPGPADPVVLPRRSAPARLADVSSGGRPRPPRRSGAAHIAAAPIPPSVGGQAARAGQPTPGLMARFTTGAKSASPAAADPPQPPAR